MLKYARIENDDTKEVIVGDGNNTAFYASIGMTEMDVEQGYDGQWYVSGYAPVEPEKTIEEQNEVIRATREQLYQQTSDKLKADYDEAVARGSEDAEELKQAWLESKDKIREENPYVVEEPIKESAAETVEEPEEVIEDGLQGEEEKVETVSEISDGDNLSPVEESGETEYSTEDDEDD